MQCHSKLPLPPKITKQTIHLVILCDQIGDPNPPWSLLWSFCDPTPWPLRGSHDLSWTAESLQIILLNAVMDHRYVQFIRRKCNFCTKLIWYAYFIMIIISRQEAHIFSEILVKGGVRYLEVIIYNKRQEPAPCEGLGLDPPVLIHQASHSCSKITNTSKFYGNPRQPTYKRALEIN